MKAAWIAVWMMIACGSLAYAGMLEKSVSPVTRQTVGADKGAQKQSEPQQQSPDKAPAVVNVTVTNEPQYTAAHAPQKANAESSKWTDPITLFTGLLFAVGVLQVWVYWKQKSVMEKALHATQTAANAADISAKAAQTQVGLMASQANVASAQKDIMQSSLEATQKAAEAAELSANAAIGVELPKLLLSSLEFGDTGAADFDAILQSPNIRAVVKNYGRTFAAIKYQSLVIVCAKSLPEAPDYKGIYPVPFAGVVIEKGEEWQLMVIDRPYFPTEDTEAIKSGKKFLWVYGFVTYQDFLGTPHERRFCQRLYITKSGGHGFAEDQNTPKAYTESN
jgi:hypothetical protein